MRSKSAGVVPALFALLGLGLLGAVPWRADARDDVVRLVRTSLEERGDDLARAEAALASELALLGAPAVPTLVGMADGSDEALYGEIVSGLHLSLGAVGGLGRVARDAMAQMPAALVLEPLRAQANGATLETRVQIIQILGALRAPEALEPVLEIITGIEALPLAYRSVRTPVKDALVSLLAADSRLEWNLPVERFLWLRPDVRFVLVEALAEVERPHAIPVTLALLREREAVDREVEEALLDGLVALRLALSWSFDDLAEFELREHLGRELDASSTESRRAAILRVGRLRDTTFVPSLIELVGDVDPSIAFSAEQALRAITGQSWTGDSWADWYDAEELWRAEHLDDELVGLSDPNPAVVVRALRALSDRALVDDEVRLAIADVLGHESPEAVLAALHALERIGATRAAVRVLDVLESDDERLVQAASASLVRLTGHQAESDRAAWELSLQL